MLHQMRDGIRPCGSQFQLCDGVSGRIQIERLGIFGNGWHRTKPREYGHLLRQRRTQRVNGLNAQACRIIEQLPSLLLVTCERRLRKFPGMPFMILRRRPITLGAFQRLQNPLAHFTRRLERKRHRNDLFRCVDARQQHEKPLRKQPRLAGARRCLNDERCRWIECAQACISIGYSFLTMGGLMQRSTGCARAALFIHDCPPASQGSSSNTVNSLIRHNGVSSQ